MLNSDKLVYMMPCVDPQVKFVGQPIYRIVVLISLILLFSFILKRDDMIEDPHH